MLLLAHTWLIRNSAWWWRKKVPEFSIPSSCTWYFKTVQCVSIFPLEIEDHKFPALCEGLGHMMPISVAGMLVLLCRAPSCWVWLESEQEELSYPCCCSAGSGMLHPLLLVPKLALLAVRLRVLQYISNYNTLFYIYYSGKCERPIILLKWVEIVL